VNKFLIVASALYLCSAAEFAISGNFKMAGVMALYAIANVLLSF